MQQDPHIFLFQWWNNLFVFFQILLIKNQFNLRKKVDFVLPQVPSSYILIMFLLYKQN